MKRTFVKIYTPNLLNERTVISSAQVIDCSWKEGRLYLNAPSGAAVKFTFFKENGLADEVTFDTVFLGGTNITSVMLLNGTEIVAQGAKAALSFPEITVSEVSLALGAGENIFVDSIIFCRSLMSLGGTRTSYNKTEYSKGGYYYLNGGNLVSWQEYKKTQAALEINYASAPLKENLKNAFNKYKVLTFELDAGAPDCRAREFALSKQIAERADRNTGYFNLELNLTEK